jgi:hypothetical protein
MEARRLTDGGVVLDGFALSDAAAELAGEDEEQARRVGWPPARSTRGRFGADRRLARGVGGGRRETCVRTARAAGGHARRRLRDPVAAAARRGNVVLGLSGVPALRLREPRGPARVGWALSRPVSRGLTAHRAGATRPHEPSRNAVASPGRRRSGRRARAARRVLYVRAVRTNDVEHRARLRALPSFRSRRPTAPGASSRGRSTSATPARAARASPAVRLRRLRPRSLRVPRRRGAALWAPLRAGLPGRPTARGTRRLRPRRRNTPRCRASGTGARRTRRPSRGSARGRRGRRPGRRGGRCGRLSRGARAVPAGRTARRPLAGRRRGP